MLSFRSKASLLLGLCMDSFTRRVEDLNHHLEGLKAAGIPEWPFGFDGRPQDQVTGPALAALASATRGRATFSSKCGEKAPFISADR